MSDRSVRKMKIQQVSPINIKVEIDQKGLKSLQDAGHLQAFMDGLSAAIGSEIKAQVSTAIASGASATLKPLTLGTYYDGEGMGFGYGRPRPIPLPHGGAVLTK